MVVTERAYRALLASCVEFVRKVECGEARSRRSYAAMKSAIHEHDNAQADPIHESRMDEARDTMGDFKAGQDTEEGA